jgi:hypothetical protein
MVLFDLRGPENLGPFCKLEDSPFANNMVSLKPLYDPLCDLLEVCRG